MVELNSGSSTGAPVEVVVTDGEMDIADLHGGGFR
jgi:hypothetical protein